MDVRELFERKEGKVPDAYREGDSLVIDCRSCGIVPMPGSDECIRCMVDRMCSEGSAGRVILRTGRDTEVSGKAGEAVMEAASLKRWALPPGEPRGKCARCGFSRRNLVETAWREFPGKSTYLSLSDEGEEPPDGKCAECIRRSRRALEQMDRRMDELMQRMGSP